MKRDSLQTLTELRTMKVDGCTRELSDKQRAAQEALRFRERCEQERVDEATRNQRVSDAETWRLTTGHARVGDLAWQAEFARGAVLRESEREQQLGLARSRERVAREESAQARARLAEAEAERVALERHGARKERVLEKQLAAAADDEAVDSFNSLHGRVRH
jgi:hypothetical protein